MTFYARPLDYLARWRMGAAGWPIAATRPLVSRLILVSNRLPVTARSDNGELSLERSSGGLASGLAKPHEESGGVWIGWPGELPRISRSQREQLDQELANLRISPVYLERAQVRGFYDEVSNGILWPVFHYRIDQMPLTPVSWNTFRKVSERFAEAAVEAYRPGDTIWVHDYQLVLVPGLIREALPGARIGFFLHVPFPAPDVFSVLPWREEILRGLLGADLVGFHTPPFVHHFIDACSQLLDLRTTPSHVENAQRTVHVGAFPLGIDVAFWSGMATTPEVTCRAEEIRQESGGRKLFVGIDRLDYTKGLLRRFVALELLLEADPDLARRLRLIQLIVPSRESIEYYSSLKRRVDEVISRINGQYGSLDSAPIHLLNRNLAPEDIAALYVAADVMLVTPVRDGMNLVAKEFVATRTNKDGVLVLSEFAGAAEELPDALVVNPYDIEEMARIMRQALEMPPEQQTTRMQKMRSQVLKNDVHVWAETFLKALEAAGGRRGSPRRVRGAVTP